MNTALGRKSDDHLQDGVGSVIIIALVNLLLLGAGYLVFAAANSSSSVAGAATINEARATLNTIGETANDVHAWNDLGARRNAGRRDRARNN